MPSTPLAGEELEFGKTLADPEPCSCPLRLSQKHQSTHFTGTRKQWTKTGPMGRVQWTSITDRIWSLGSRMIFKRGPHDQSQVGLTSIFHISI